MFSFCALLVKLVSIAALALSQNPVTSHTAGGGKGSDAICTVKEWFGGKAVMTGTMVDGNHTVTQSMTIYYYSALKQKMILYPMFQNQRLIYDYPAHALYTIKYTRGGWDSTCTKSTLDGNFQEICVPDNRTITVDPHTSFGAGNYVTYGWEAKGQTEGLTHRMTMSLDNLPMFEEVTGIKDGGPYFESVYYFNTTVVSFNSDTFKVPSNCP